MTQFDASLVVGNDPNPIATTVALDGANLELSAAGHSLGKWPIADLAMERIFGGYRMSVEGEKAVLKLNDPEPFAEAIEIATGTRVAAKPAPEKKKKTREKKTREKKAQQTRPRRAKKEKAPRAAKTETTPAADIAETDVVEAQKPAKKEGGAGWLDQKLEVAQRRFGKYLPDWLFTTGGLVIVLAVLGMIIAKPVWFSVVFLLIAAIGLITSAIALLDQVVAVRIFRRGFTPIQGLILSLFIGLFGILLGLFR